MCVVEAPRGFRSDDPPEPRRKRNGHRFNLYRRGREARERPHPNTLYSWQNPPPTVAAAQQRSADLAVEIETISEQLRNGLTHRKGVALTPAEQDYWRHHQAEPARRGKKEEKAFCDRWAQQNRPLFRAALTVFQALQGDEVEFFTDDLAILRKLEQDAATAEEVVGLYEELLEDEIPLKEGEHIVFQRLKGLCPAE